MATKEDHIDKITIYKMKASVKTLADFVKAKDSKKNDLPKLIELKSEQLVGFDGTYEAWSGFKETGGNEKTEKDFPWIGFINGAISSGDPYSFKSFNKLPSGIIIVKIAIGGNETFFAITFGMAGDSFIDQEKIVPDFGIKVAMNICDEDKLNRIQTSIHEAVSTQTERQISANSNLSSFNINAEKEFLRMLVGVAKEEFKYIKLFKGKESLSIKIDKDDELTWKTLIPRLHNLNLASQSNEYRKIFTEYDKFPFENDKEVIAKLDELLFEKIKTADYSGVHLSPPEFFDYDNFSFVYNPDQDPLELHDELSINGLIDSKSRAFNEKSNIDSIKNMRISLFNAETDKMIPNKWSAYKCLVAEIEYKSDVYVLSVGQWRKVSTELKDEVSNYIAGISIVDHPYLPKGVSLWNPLAKKGKGQNEEAMFNKAASKTCDELFLFDKAKISIAGDKTYEVCDLFHTDKKFIQVKRYEDGAASVSHLFVQARFYGEAFLFDQKCRKGMKDHIRTKSPELSKDVNKFFNLIDEDRTKFEAGDYQICLCILTEQVNFSFSDLPFMSKYELMHTFKYLTNIGFKCEITFRDVKIHKK